MEQRDYIMVLYDYYSELLTDKQKEYFEDYYFNNYSLSEISDNLNISRNAIHKSLKIVEEKLLEYEDKLSLYKKSIKLNKIIGKIDDKEIQKELKELL